MLRIVNYNFTWQFTSWQQTSFWPEDEENGGSELTTMSSQLRKTRSMDSSCLELRLGPLPGNPQSSGGHLGPTPHLPAVLSRARSEANLHASTLSLGPGTLSCCSCFLSFFFFFATMILIFALRYALVPKFWHFSILTFVSFIFEKLSKLSSILYKLISIKLCQIK